MTASTTKKEPRLSQSEATTSEKQVLWGTAIRDLLHLKGAIHKLRYLGWLLHSCGI